MAEKSGSFERPTQKLYENAFLFIIVLRIYTHQYIGARCKYKYVWRWEVSSPNVTLDLLVVLVYVLFVILY